MKREITCTSEVRAGPQTGVEMKTRTRARKKVRTKVKKMGRERENNSLPLLLHLRQHYGEMTRSRHQQNPWCKHKHKHG